MISVNVGDHVQTAYGPGKVLERRAKDDFCVVRLSFGLLIALPDSLGPTTCTTNDITSCGGIGGIAKNANNNDQIKNDADEPSSEKRRQRQRQQEKIRREQQQQQQQKEERVVVEQCMELNVAYEALERMRVLNLELKCEELGIDNADLTKCTTCLLASSKRKRRVYKMIRVRAMDQRCLSCAAPVCARHSCPRFRKQGISICLDCNELFSVDFCVNVLAAPSCRERGASIARMMETYDRICILLKFGEKFIRPVADDLEQSAARRNRFGVGSSSAGMVSGALGIAAAATILTPAGPPLLIASLLFGGSASVISTSVEYKHQTSRPARLAHRIIALHAMLQSLIQVANVLRDAMVRYHICMDPTYAPPDRAVVLPADDDGAGGHARNSLVSTGCVTGMTVALTGASVAGAEVAAGVELAATEMGSVASRNASFFSRAGTDAMQALRFAQFVGGALSGAVLLLEARNLTKALQRIQQGNPCAQAEALRSIGAEMQELPRTSQLEHECKGYLDALSKRDVPMTVREATDMLFPAQVEEQEEEFIGQQQSPSAESSRHAGKDVEKQPPTVAGLFQGLRKSFETDSTLDDEQQDQAELWEDESMLQPEAELQDPEPAAAQAPRRSLLGGLLWRDSKQNEPYEVVGTQQVGDLVV